MVRALGMFSPILGLVCQIVPVVCVSMHAHTNTQQTYTHRGVHIRWHNKYKVMKEDCHVQQWRGQECSHAFPAFHFSAVILNSGWATCSLCTIASQLEGHRLSPIALFFPLYSLCLFSCLTFTSGRKKSILLPLVAPWWTDNLSRLSRCLLPSVCWHIDIRYLVILKRVKLGRQLKECIIGQRMTYLLLSCISDVWSVCCQSWKLCWYNFLIRKPSWRIQL